MRIQPGVNICRIFAIAALVFAIANPMMTIASPGVGSSDPRGTVNVHITDTASKKPLAYVRVMLTGCDLRVGYTDVKGDLTFENVTLGSCDISAEAENHKRSEPYSFTLAENESQSIAFEMSETASKVIASVRSARGEPVSQARVGTKSSQYLLDGDLSSALGFGSDVLQGNTGMSIDGKDDLQTGYAVDGVPVAGLGTAGLQGVDPDLFGGASVSTTASQGSLAGTLSYETALPTVSWISGGAASYGQFGSYSERVLETGSVGDVGIVAAYALRSSADFTNGQRYADTSGLDYAHQGVATTNGLLAKIRVPVTQSTSLTLTGITSNGYGNVVCPYDLGTLPCGYGPTPSASNSDRRATLTFAGIIGHTSVSLSYFESNTSQIQNMDGRIIALTPYPFYSQQSLLSHGAMGLIGANVGPNNVADVTFTTYSLSESYSQTAPSNNAQLQSSTSYFEAKLDDTYSASRNISVEGVMGMSGTTGTPTAPTASLGASYQAGSRDTIVAQMRLGNQQVALSSPTLAADPASLIYDCANHEIVGSIQGGTTGAQHSETESLGWQHRATKSRFFANASLDAQAGVPANTIVNAAFLPAGALPVGYVQQVNSFAKSSSGCPLDTFSLPSDLYLQTLVGDVRRRYTTARAGFAGEAIRNLQYGAFVTAVNARIYSNDPLLNNPYSIYVPGRQIPNVPYAKGSLIFDYRNPRSPIEEIVAAQYLSSNNPLNLPANSQLLAGVAWNSPIGKIVVSGRNLTSTYAGTFYGPQYAVPLGSIGGQSFGTIAQPYHQRSFNLLFLPRIGPAGTEREPPVQIDQGNTSPSGFVETQFLPLTQSVATVRIGLRNASGSCEASTYRRLKPSIDEINDFVASLKPSGSSYKKTFGPVTVVYIPLQRSYALELVPRDFATAIGMLSCVSLHQGSDDQYRQLGLYTPPDVSVGVTNILYSPRVGAYFYIRAPHSGPSVTFASLPKQPPVNPFAIKAQCSKESLPIVQRLVSQIEPIVTNPKVGKNTIDGGIVVTQALPDGVMWSDIQITDVFAVSAVEECLSVAETDALTIKKLGANGAPLPDLNYTREFGLYVVGQ
jgi:hypothetical protein